MIAVLKQSLLLSNMNKLIYFIVSVFSVCGIAQNNLTGIILDNKNNETLIGANIVLIDTNDPEKKIGAVTNFEGRFEFNNLSSQSYQLTVSYIGYKSQTQSILFDTTQKINLSIKLKADVILSVVSVVGDQAEFRKTPVSLSNVK